MRETQCLRREGVTLPLFTASSTAASTLARAALIKCPRCKSVRVGFPPTGRTLNIGEQERHDPGRRGPVDTRTGCHTLSGCRQLTYNDRALESCRQPVAAASPLFNIGDGHLVNDAVEGAVPVAPSQVEGQYYRDPAAEC